MKQLQIADVENRLITVFRQHGAIPLKVPLLLPKNHIVSSSESDVGKPAEFMDDSGTLVTLPWDLRFGFARYVARKQINRLKRYCFDKVYRPVLPSGSHPKELIECAFDIVTMSPHSGLVAVAEVIAVLSEIVQAFPNLYEKNCVCKVNHSALLQAILLNCGITDPLIQTNVLAALEQSKGSKKERERYFYALKDISDQTLNTLNSLLVYEPLFSQFERQLKSLTRRKDNSIAHLTKTALDELKLLKVYAEMMDVSMAIVFCSDLVVRPSEYNSGMMFQVGYYTISQKTRKTEKLPDVKQKLETFAIWAAGGRYDSLVDSFRKPAMEAVPFLPVIAVGVSISFGTVVALCSPKQLFQEGDRILPKIQRPLDLLVCSSGGNEKTMLKQKLSLCSDLRTAGISTDYLYETVSDLEDLQDYCFQNGVYYIAVLKEGDLSVRLKLWSQKDKRFVEKKVGLTAELISSVLKEYEVPFTEQTAISSVPVPLKSTGCAETPCQNVLNLNVQFVTDYRLSGHKRKVYENQINAGMTTIGPKLASKVTVEVLATDLPKDVLRTVAAHLEWRTPSVFQDSTSGIIEKCANKYKSKLQVLFGGLSELLVDTGSAMDSKIIVIFSFTDDEYRVLV